MAIAIARGGEAIGRVLDALGLNASGVDRLVIVCELDAPVMVYVRKYLHEEEMDAIADNLVEPAPAEVKVTTAGGLEVDEQGRVFVPAAEYAVMRAVVEDLANHWVGDDAGSASLRERARRAIGGV